MPFPTIMPTVPTLVRSLQQRCGDNPFLIADGHVLTYVDLDLRSSQLAMALLAEGIGKGDHVGILMPNSVEWALAWFAATRIGAVAVPLNTFYKASELAWTARHADLRAVLAWSAFRNHDFVGRLEEALPGLADSTSRAASSLHKAPFLRTSECGDRVIGPGRRHRGQETTGRHRRRFPCRCRVLRDPADEA